MKIHLFIIALFFSFNSFSQVHGIELLLDSLVLNQNFKSFEIKDKNWYRYTIYKTSKTQFKRVIYVSQYYFGEHEAWCDSSIRKNDTIFNFNDAYVNSKPTAIFILKKRTSIDSAIKDTGTYYINQYLYGDDSSQNIYVSKKDYFHNTQLTYKNGVPIKQTKTGVGRSKASDYYKYEYVMLIDYRKNKIFTYDANGKDVEVLKIKLNKKGRITQVKRYVFDHPLSYPEFLNKAKKPYTITRYKVTWT
ncbi:MAG TPA: hypothetical protein VK177_13200 [Flavobacteriales bacterium]|nr:hypothetical protein [Flavobacteriales bacterium]